ncbi:uncharacterized protein EV154DRAFT_482869 [Mucor mucedo]|uniref:uncharacterized protein n=1 Tax=Mucor mucedo TaxID=29922 RepID=UPI0022200860|nr:uncharacterized protein EV154DRAFT_482869 [Mucor mucedo]KAI7889752.1 hypothetical protein EV154DRAFT_482869 [Mucor mucedo]
MDKEINSKEENSVYEVFLSIHSWVACRCRFHSEFMNIKRALLRKLDPKEISGSIKAFKINCVGLNDVKITSVPFEQPRRPWKGSPDRGSTEKSGSADQSSLILTKRNKLDGFDKTKNDLALTMNRVDSIEKTGNQESKEV